MTRSPEATAVPAREEWCPPIERSILLVLSPGDRRDSPGAVATDLARLLPPLVEDLRTAEDGAGWAWDRHDGPGGPVLRLRFRTAAEKLPAIEEPVREVAERLGWTVDRTTEEREPAPAQHGPVRRIRCALAEVSSDLVTERLRHGPLSGSTACRLTTLHLAALVDLVPEAARAPFLFGCWLDAARPLSPGCRVAIARCSAPAAGRVAGVVGSAGRDGDGTAWDRYRTRVRAAGGGAPEMLFALRDHAHATHRRLGVPASVAALVPLALRSVLLRPRAAPGG